MQLFIQIKKQEEQQRRYPSLFESLVQKNNDKYIKGVKLRRNKKCLPKYLNNWHFRICHKQFSIFLTSSAIFKQKKRASTCLNASSCSASQEYPQITLHRLTYWCLNCIRCSPADWLSSPAAARLAACLASCLHVVPILQYSLCALSLGGGLSDCQRVSLWLTAF